MQIRNKKIISWILAVFLLFCVFGSLFVNVAFSQETEETNALNDYNLAFDDYKEAHDEYVQKRAQYLKFDTLKSKSDAYDAFLIMLEARDQVVISYLKYLKLNLGQVSSGEVESKEGLNIAIETELSWFGDHKNTLSSAGTLDNLVSDSNEAKERYKLVRVLAYEVFAATSYGRLERYHQRVEEMFSKVGQEIEAVSKEEREGYKFSSEKLDTLNRWLLESEDTIAKGEEEQVKILDYLISFSKMKKVKDALGHYNKSMKVVDRARLYYKQACSLLKEVIEEIKIAE